MQNKTTNGTAEINTFRTIARKTRRDQVRSLIIRDQCKGNDMIIFARKRRKGWSDHVNA